MLLYSTAQFDTRDVILNHGLEKQPGQILKEVDESGGDYRICYGNSIIFGRDIFGRKSLCGRILKNEHRIEVEITAGFFNKKCVDSFEFPPGTLHQLDNLFNITATKQSICFEVDVETLTVHTYYELDKKHPFYAIFKNINIVKKDASSYLCLSEQFDVNPSVSDMDIMADELIKRLSSAVKAVFQPRLLIPEDKLDGTSAIPEQLSICFSGGIDSLMVTVLAAKTLTEVRQFNLVNTVFGEGEKDFEIGSDRKKALECFDFLTKNFGPKFSMILVNVLCDEIAPNRQIIENAMLPCYTILDESLASVMWFGSRAKGIQIFAPGYQGLNFQPSNCALLGSGADELLGGYARHRTIFDQGGWQSLHAELSMEIGRIGARNFGRDDRIALSNGVHLLAPFMSDDFVKWINQVPLPYRVDFREPRGLGEKRLLRVALRRLGLPSELTDTPKKAMQFGSGYARLENKGKKGDMRSVNIIC